LLEDVEQEDGGGASAPASSHWRNAKKLRREEASRTRSREPVTAAPLPAVDIYMDLDTESPASEVPPSPEPRPNLAHSYTTLAHGIPIQHDVDDINTNMETIQAVITGLKGRTDEYSVKCKAGLECDLHALRVAKTKLKPLDDQQSILEILVEKRTTHFSLSEHNVQQTIADMEAAKQSLMVAQKQLLDVKHQQAAAETQAALNKAEQQVPDNMKSVQKMQDLVCLLPAGMAGGFGQCLQLLEGLLQQANAAAHEARVQEVPDSDSESAASAFSRSQRMETTIVPDFPGGNQPPLGASSFSTAELPPTDPYMTGVGCRTPPRTRAKSAEPERSPATRSRTHSPSMNRPFRGKCESMEESFPAENPCLWDLRSRLQD
jgi:hypothetical protein